MKSPGYDVILGGEKYLTSKTLEEVEDSDPSAGLDTKIYNPFPGGSAELFLAFLLWFVASLLVTWT